MLLPLVPSLEGGPGLLKNDAVFFQKSAVAAANNIRDHGWATWTLWSTETNSSGNVGVLAALYVLFHSSDPAIIIPINALLHATSALLLLLIGREIWPGRIGNLAGLIAASLFVLFPSALSWYSQPLKDSYVIGGALLILYSLLKLCLPESGQRVVKWLFLFVAGMLLTVFVKAYYEKLIVVITVLTALIAIPWAMWTRAPQRRLTFFSFGLAMVLLFGVHKCMPLTALDGTQYEKIDFTIFQQAIIDQMATTGRTATAGQTAMIDLIVKAWSWQDSPVIPDFVEKPLETVAKTRAGIILYNQLVNANTLVDAEHKPDSVVSLLLYLPRALQVGAFAPFPNTWLSKPSLVKLGVFIETAIWYMIAPGIFLALLYRRSLQLAIALVFSTFFITVFSFVGPNVGTLYRARYAFEFLLILIGLGGWLMLFARHFRSVFNRPAPTPAIKNASSPDAIGSGGGKKTALRSAIMVSALTLVGGLGFFARDFFMSRWFGMGSEMDAFVLGTMIPMLVVAVFVIPAGAAITPVYAELHHENPQHASRLLLLAAAALSAILAVLALFIYAFLPHLLTVLGSRHSDVELAAIAHITHIYLLILWVGGLTALGNSALTAVGKVAFPTLAQLVVPIIAFGALVLFGTRYSIYPVAYAMLVGVVVNLALVVYGLTRNRLLPPRPLSLFTISHHLPAQQYAFLVIAASASALLIPVANAMSVSLAVGSVAIISLGIKVILLITGVVGIGINTVFLPYFSKLIARLQHAQARADFAFFILFLTLLSVPATLMATLLIEPMVNMLFHGSKLTESDLISLREVIKYGVIQLPFFACSLVAGRYVAAYQRSGILMLSALCGLIVTVMLGSVLSKVMGVAGISLAITFGSFVSASILILYTNHLRHFSMINSVFIGLNWMMFLTLFLFLHYQMYLGFFITGISYAVLAGNNWLYLISNWKHAEQ